jgi:hypothetical protein
MRSFHVCGRTLATSVIAFGIGMAVVPTASADPNDPDQTATPAPGPGAPPPATVAAPVADGMNPAAADACKQFNTAVGYAATNYEDFAYATAGGGNLVNYNDPEVRDSNVVGRTALREAAAVALNASTTPGLPPEISAPMQSWSMNAARLVLVMGVRGGGDALNSTATDLNTDAHNAQMACAAAGVHG